MCIVSCILLCGVFFMFGRGVRLKRRGPAWLRKLDWFSVNMIVLFGVWVLCMVLILVCVRVFL